MSEPDSESERILVLSSSDREAHLATRHLEAAGLSAAVCGDVRELCHQIEQGAGAALCIEERLTVPAERARLEAALAGQPAWSDFPLLVVASRKRSTHARHEPLESLGNVSLLDAPLRVRTMIRAAHAALRARRRQYAAKRAIVERDRFLAMLGHELRNPLSAIALATEVAVRVEGARAPHLPVVRRQVEHLTRLVDDLLDVARVTTGRINLELEPVRLDLLLEEVASSMRTRFVRAGVTLSVDIAARPVVHGDRVRLEQVISNLLTNAVKYTSHGGRALARIGRDERHAHVTVSDDGVGIPADVLPHVFEQFVQGESTLDRAQGGMGVGLALVRTLVELHGGTVRVRSEGRGRGSEFTFCVPLWTGASRKGPSGPPSSDIECDDARRTVLLVEDNEDARELLAIALDHAGHSVVQAEDGEKALVVLRDRRVDAAIVDIGLPKLDGFEVARRVRRSLGDDVLLIALSGYGQLADRSRALEAGFDVHLTKPADFSTLCALLSTPKTASA